MAWNKRLLPLGAASLIILTGATTAAPAADDDPPMVPPESAAPAIKGNANATNAGKATWRDSLHALGITGSLRGGFWSSNRRVDDESNIAVASAWLKLDKKLDNGIGLYAEGYLVNEDVFGDQRDSSRLREAYLEGRKGQFDYRVGKQTIAWGRADRLNPTDNLTPRDFTLLAPDVDEDRYGVLAAKGMWNFTPSINLTAVWLPEFQPNVVALPSVPGTRYHEELPTSSRTWALKFDQSGGAVDWSVSYFNGFDLAADISRGAVVGGITTINLKHNRLKVFGGDIATARGDYRYAFEAAYARTDDPDGVDPGVKNPFFYGVFGIERDFGDNLDVIVQIFMRQVQNYSAPEDIADPAIRALAIQQAVVSNQYDRRQEGVSARIAKKWFNETLEGELAAVMLLNRDGFSIRPKLTYAVSDTLKVMGGVEWFHGSDKTTYGLLEKNKGLFAEVRYFF
jgi:hypothetical protein